MNIRPPAWLDQAQNDLDAAWPPAVLEQVKSWDTP